MYIERNEQLEEGTSYCYILSKKDRYDDVSVASRPLLPLSITQRSTLHELSRLMFRQYQNSAIAQLHLHNICFITSHPKLCAVYLMTLTSYACDASCDPDFFF